MSLGVEWKNKGIYWRTQWVEDLSVRPCEEKNRVCPWASVTPAQRAEDMKLSRKTASSRFSERQCMKAAGDRAGHPTCAGLRMSLTCSYMYTCVLVSKNT